MAVARQASPRAARNEALIYTKVPLVAGDAAREGPEEAVYTRASAAPGSPSPLAKKTRTAASLRATDTRVRVCTHAHRDTTFAADSFYLFPRFDAAGSLDLSDAMTRLCLFYLKAHLVSLPKRNRASNASRIVP